MKRLVLPDRFKWAMIRMHLSLGNLCLNPLLVNVSNRVTELVAMTEIVHFCGIHFAVFHLRSAFTSDHEPLNVHFVMTVLRSH